MHHNQFTTLFLPLSEKAFYDVSLRISGYDFD
jgi:hypothetical protein